MLGNSVFRDVVVLVSTIPNEAAPLSRFEGNIKGILENHRFRTDEDLKNTILRYVRLYNRQSPQSAIKDRTPIDALKDCHRKKPEIFKKRPHDHAGSGSCV